MTQREPIVEFLYGWGWVMRLYDDYLEAHGTSYALAELVSVHSICHCILGVSSLRLEVCFQHDRVSLRGIAAIEDAQRAMAYLSRRMHPVTNKPPIIGTTLPDQVAIAGGNWRTEDLLPASVERRLLLHSDHARHARITEARTSTLPIGIARWQMILQEQRARKLKHLQAERAKREHGFDVEQLAIRLQGEPLPQVYVPTRLLASEYAHYCTEATLCEEPLPGSMQGSYRIKDQGMLILTGKRMIYIGRKRQLVLSYSRLLHVSNLRGAIAVLSESWSRREIFEISQPLECIMYLDAILLRFCQQGQNMRGEKKLLHVRQLYPVASVYHAPTTTPVIHSDALPDT